MKSKRMKNNQKFKENPIWKIAPGKQHSFEMSVKRLMQCDIETKTDKPMERIREK